ncbi:MAG TPA: PAS domain-containing protein, partial [Polyangiaceae bacterium]|nr:PAS domain-containing protein [Polyangiaceae bacterium]
MGDPQASSPARPDRLLDLVYELESLRAQLALRAENEVRLRLEVTAARERYFDIFEAAPVGYLTVDADLHVLHANLTAGAQLGLERRALSFMRLEDVFEGSAVDTVRRAATDAVVRDETITVYGVRPRGRDLRLKLAFAPSRGTLLVTLLEQTDEERLQAQAEAAKKEQQAVLDAIAS